jgi:hypothetical protein
MICVDLAVGGASFKLVGVLLFDLFNAVARLIGARYYHDDDAQVGVILIMLLLVSIVALIPVSVNVFLSQKAKISKRAAALLAIILFITPALLIFIPLPR